MENHAAIRRVARPAIWAWVVLGLLAPLVSVGNRAQAGENYAFLVGVRKYKSTQLKSLNYPESDVTVLADVLKRSGYASPNVVLMTQTTGAEDTRFLPIASHIKAEIQLLLKELTEQDSVLVAFAGHGVQFKGENVAYFCPADADLADRQTLVSLTGLYRALDRCRARSKVLLVDACRNDPQSNYSRSTAEVVLEPVGRPQRLKPPGGITALFSCSAGEQAYEHPRLKHGVFFHFVIQGLSGKADLNPDGQISLAELEEYTVQKVQRFVRTELGESQTPERSGEARGQVALATLLNINADSQPVARAPFEPPVVGPAPFEPEVEPASAKGPRLKESKPKRDEKAADRVAVSLPPPPELFGPPVKTSLIAYALLPDDEQRRWGSWVLSISTDQTRVTLRGMKTRKGAIRGTLRDDPFTFAGKRMLTFDLPESNADMISAIRVPADGNGLGQVFHNGAWTFNDPVKRPEWVLRFQTSVPSSGQPGPGGTPTGPAIARPTPNPPPDEAPVPSPNVKRFVLEVPGNERIRSLVLMDGEALVVGDNQGRSFVYLRRPDRDSGDGGYWGYFCREANQYLRWPAAGVGQVHVGVDAGGEIRWRASQMRARAVD
jgi:uncharacterized caspase-like protein